MLNFCTLFDKNFLVKGVTMHQSILQNSKDEFKLFILCLDDTTYEISEKLQLQNVELIKLSQIENEELKKIKKERDQAEYSWTLKPYLLEYIFNNYKIDKLVYLDGDLFFFNSPKFIFDELNDSSVLLTPHNIPEKRKHQEEEYGIYNAGMIGFKNDKNGRSCLSWWKMKCLEWCYREIEAERQGDQKYLNYFEQRFNNVKISKNSGLNLALWNLDNYKKIYKKNDEIFVDNDKLVFFHFAKFEIYYPRCSYLPNTPLDYYSKSIFKKIIFSKYTNQLYLTLKKIRSISTNFKDGTTNRPKIGIQIRKELIPIIYLNIRKFIKDIK